MKKSFAIIVCAFFVVGCVQEVDLRGLTVADLGSSSNLDATSGSDAAVDSGINAFEDLGADLADMGTNTMQDGGMLDTGTNGQDANASPSACEQAGNVCKTRLANNDPPEVTCAPAIPSNLSCHHATEVCCQ